jgi:hypothetical protein
MNDASEAGDAGTGEKGNLLLEVIEEGGRIVEVASPDNYTEKCWAAYGDAANWEDKLSRLEAWIGGELPGVIAGWRDEPVPATPRR